MEKKRLEIIVGGFVILGLSIFCFFVFFINGVYLFRSGYSLNIEFRQIAGISKGATVRCAGVSVGEISALTTQYDKTGKPLVIVKVWLADSVVVREFSVVEIRGAFALSEAYIEILNRGEEDGRVLKNGDFIRGTEPVPLDSLIREGEEITRIMKNILINMESFIEDEEMKRSCKNVVTNVDALTKRLNNILYTSEDEIIEVIANAEQSFTQLHQMLKNANEVVSTIESKEGTVGKLVYDDELYTDVMEFIQDIKAHPWKLLKKSKSKKKD